MFHHFTLYAVLCTQAVSYHNLKYDYSVANLTTLFDRFIGNDI